MMRALAAAALAAVLAGSVQAHLPRVGEPAPDFTLTLADGAKLHLADLRGQVVVLNFWATWCAPCKRELPLLDGYYRVQAPHGLKVFAVTTEDSIQWSKLAKLQHALAIPLLRGMKGPYRDLDAVPTNYVIDRAGVLRYAQARAFELDDLNALLVPLLQQPAP